MLRSKFDKHTKLKQFLLTHWFLVGIFVAILLAKLKPDIGAKGGILMPEITVRIFAVAIIFFLSGISLKLEDLKRAVFLVKTHVFIQSFTLLFIPFFMQVVVHILQLFPADEWLLKGLLTVGCMPPPVSSAVILTKTVGGNEATAIFNSVLGSFLGIIVTPITLLYFLGFSTSISQSSVIEQLCFTVIFPFLLGQFIKMYIKETFSRTQVKTSNISSFMLLVIIYATFCDTFFHEDLDIDLTSLLFITITVGCIQILFMFIVFHLTTEVFRSFTPADTVAILFCATHKSLTLGIPMLKILFSGYSYLSHICIPLLIYHPTQILLGGILAPYLHQWMVKAQRRYYFGYSAV